MKECNETSWKPELEIVRFGTADIVTTSSVLDEDELPPFIIDELIK